MTLRFTLMATAALLAATGTSPALAEVGDTEATPNANGRSSDYSAAFFARYAPRNALDIVRRIPGFQLDLGAAQNQDGGQVDVRGFAGTAGNVVINGARPSAKSESLEAYLSRIPASQVKRVEVGPGDLFGSDYASKNQVANIIMAADGGIDGNVSVSARRHYNGYINKDASTSVMIRRGASAINLSAGTGRNRQFEEGTDTFSDAITGDQIEFRRKHNSYFNRDPFVSASWSLERASDKAIRLNGRWQPSRFDLFQYNRVTPEGGAPHDDNLLQRFRNPLIELGGDITRPLGGGAVKFVGLVTRRKRDDFEHYMGREGLREDDAPVVFGFEEYVKAKRNETIGRASWTRSNLAGFSVEVGAEAAFNSLTSNVDFFEIEDGVRSEVDLPIADATVKETRGEAYVSVGRNLSPALRIDGGVNYERSSLKVGGDADARRKLSFIKPNIAVDWKPGGGWHTRLSLRRNVAQLDFYDFISQADLSAGRIDGGNENLEPQRAWELRFTADRPILGQGTVKLELGADLVQKLQDRILIYDDKGKAFDAPGNLGTGRHLFASLTVDAPLDRVWKGLRARFDGAIRRTRVDDPITGKPRNFSGFFPDWEWSVDVRRDSGPWSYGFAVNRNADITFFRTDEFDTNGNDKAYGTAFVEYRPGPRTTVRFDVDNALNTRGIRSREIFRPNRADPDDIYDEFRERNRHVTVALTLKQTFGGASGGGVAK